jgi:hypothetical protein
VITENQFGRSDHDHFGKAMTYLAAHEAKTVIGIAESFADEHRAALTWLNDNTPEEMAFYAIAPQLIRIADSLPGLRFEIVVGPNRFVKKQKTIAPDLGLNSVREIFWKTFREAAKREGETGTIMYGGRLNFLWISPPVSARWLEDDPHVLIYLAKSTGTQVVGVDLRCRDGASPEALSLLQQAVSRSIAAGLTLGRSSETAIRLGAEGGIEAAIGDLLPKVRRASLALSEVFDESAPA